MQIEEHRIKIRDLIPEYREDFESGRVFCLIHEEVDGRSVETPLDIRPEYQREYVYSGKQRDAVINTILNGFPLNTMYFVKRPEGGYEVMDGQQRIISINQFAANQFSIMLPNRASGELIAVNYPNLDEQLKEKFLDYHLQVYICEGSDSEKMDWFQVINIAGEKLFDQEIRNALYHSQWLTDAKSLFSRRNNAAERLYGKYLSGNYIRQDYLETAFKWKADDEGFTGKKDKMISAYMRQHQNDENANELWNYFENVFRWVKQNFGRSVHKSMNGVEWGLLYNRHKDENINPEKLQSMVQQLLADEEVENKKGIYEYLLTGEEKLLNLRGFKESEKQTAYTRQEGKCAICGKPFDLRVMHADHVTPWVQGGKTNIENLQMLCRDCNLHKGAQIQELERRRLMQM